MQLHNEINLYSSKKDRLFDFGKRAMKLALKVVNIFVEDIDYLITFIKSSSITS